MDVPSGGPDLRRGNWLADEVLYQARIHPEQPVCDLSDGMIGVLHSDLKKVIGLAVEVDSDSTRFPKDWLFHYRYIRYFLLGCEVY
jgi:formamidopyrimidine-DNA glycosylase